MNASTPRHHRIALWRPAGGPVFYLYLDRALIGPLAAWTTAAVLLAGIIVCLVTRSLPLLLAGIGCACMTGGVAMLAGSLDHAGRHRLAPRHRRENP